MFILHHKIILLFIVVPCKHRVAVVLVTLDLYFDSPILVRSSETDPADNMVAFRRVEYIHLVSGIIALWAFDVLGCLSVHWLE